jgi:hypothetical protein
VLEQPPGRIIISKATIEKHNDRAPQILERLSAIKENLGNPKDALNFGPEQSAIFDKPVHFARSKPEALAHLGDGEPHRVNLICHISRVPCPGAKRYRAVVRALHVMLRIG